MDQNTHAAMHARSIEITLAAKLVTAAYLHELSVIAESGKKLVSTRRVAKELERAADRMRQDGILLRSACDSRPDKDA